MKMKGLEGESVPAKIWVVRVAVRGAAVSAVDVPTAAAPDMIR
jgi:hypothetical protein